MSDTSKYGIRLSWDNFKALLDNGSPFREMTLPGSVRLIIQDGDTRYQTIIHTDGDMSTEYADYQANYETNKNKALVPKDSDGSPLSRIKTTKSGWAFQYHAVEITTGLENGYHNHKIDPTTFVKSDLGFCSMKFYDNTQTEVTGQVNITANAVLTTVDWVVDHEMEIVGAQFAQNAAPASNVYMYVVAAPGIANIDFGTGGINLKHFPAGAIGDADGQSAKYMHPSLPVPGVNKFRFLIEHGIGVQHTFQVIFRLFKP